MLGVGLDSHDLNKKGLHLLKKILLQTERGKDIFTSILWKKPNYITAQCEETN